MTICSETLGGMDLRPLLATPMRRMTVIQGFRDFTAKSIYGRWIYSKLVNLFYQVS